MRRTTKIAALIGAAALLLAGCAEPETGGDGGGNGSGGGGSAGEGKPGSDVKVGVAYDVGGRGDQSFNDAAARGLDRAKKEFGVQAEELEAADGEAESAREERLRTLADSGYNPIIAVGFVYATSVAKVAPEYENQGVQFVLVDSTDATGPNIANLVFAEHEGSFLVGAAAALKTKTNHIGFVGGVETPLIQKFEAGYAAGAKHVKSNITIDRTYLTQPPDFSGFGDPAKGRTAAQGQFDAGADIVYHAAGGSGTGVFEAAKNAGGLAIGVDSNQYLTAPKELKPVIMTSMLKKLDVAVYDYLKAFVEGNPPTGEQVYDLASNGVGYATSGGKVDDITDQLEKYKQQIIDGEIKVPTSP